MKKTIAISLLALTTSINAQIKIFPGGSVTYGATSTGLSAKHHFVGNFLAVTSSSNTTSGAALIRGNSGNTSAASPEYTWLGNDQTGLFHPATDVIGFTIGGNEAMRIYSNKKLFIGTQPNTGSPWLDGQLTISNPTANDQVLVINHNVNADWKGALTCNLTRTNSTTYGVNLSGTTNFYVAGAGWIYSQGNYLGSDINIKDDIKTIDSATVKLNQLKGVVYKLKKEKQNPSIYGTVAKEYMGVIAQDVEKVAPQAVKTVHDGTKAVSYEMLVGLLIEGFKEQSAKVAQLESDLNACCAKNGGKTTQRTINSSNDNSSNINNQSYLFQNKPNPFNKETIIEYNIVEEGTASILLFDMNGKLIKTISVKIPGQGSVIINAKDLNAGMYYYSLIVNDKEIDTKKMIITE